MWACFTPTPDLTPYAAIAARYDLKEKNKDKTALARQTATFNLVQIDAAPDREFNEVIWKTVHGEHSIMPSPVRSAFIKPIPETEEGDDD